MKPTEPTRAVPPQRKPRRIWLWALGLLCLVFGVFAGWILLRHHQAKSALAKYEQELVAQGEKLTFAELWPPLPEGQNKALELVAACLSLRTGAVLTVNAPPALKSIAPGKALVIIQQQDWVINPRKGSYRWEQLAEDLQLNRKALDELRTLVRSPLLRYPLNYRGLSTLLPHLARMKTGAQHLSASALYHVRTGDIESAVDDIEAILLLSRFTTDEPSIISQLVRIAVVSIALQDCWALLQAERLPEEQLVRLQKILELDLTTGMVHALRGERVMARDTIHGLRSDKLNFQDLVDSLSSVSGEDTVGVVENLPYNDEIRGAIRATVIQPMWRFIWSYEDERHTLDDLQELLEAIDQSRTQRSVAPLRIARDRNARRLRGAAYQSWSHWATRIFLTAPAEGPLRAFRCQTHLEMTRTAIALKRYHLQHRKYPETLDQLVPEFLPSAPVDWMNGQKLLYRIEGGSFVLWSVGDNGYDDSASPDGTEPYNLLEGPDIVWPQPPSAAELEAYHEKTRPRQP